MAKAHLKLVQPRTVNGTVPPRRQKNVEVRTREYLTESEIDRLVKSARANRYGLRDATIILMAFRHGLRAAELVDLRWEQVELGRNAVLHVRRVKQGVPSVHPLQGDEMRALRELKRSAPFTVCLHLRARCAVHHGWLRQDDCAGGESGEAYRCSPAHASTCLRLRTGEQRTRHACPASLSGPQKHPAHRALHGAIANAVEIVQSFGSGRNPHRHDPGFAPYEIRGSTQGESLSRRFDMCRSGCQVMKPLKLLVDPLQRSGEDLLAL
jgi:integrase